MRMSTTLNFNSNYLWLPYVGWLLFIWISFYFFTSCFWLIIVLVGKKFIFSSTYALKLINDYHGWSWYICNFSNSITYFQQVIFINTIPEIIRNLQRERQKLARLLQVLVREGAYTRTTVVLYTAVVQAVLLY